MKPKGRKLTIKNLGCDFPVRYIWNYHLGLVTLLIILTTLINGSTIVWLSNLLKGEGGMLTNFILLIGSFTITVIPDILISNQSAKAEFEGVRRYIKDFSDKYQDTPEFILDKKFREQQEPWVMNGSQSVIKEAQTVIHCSIYSLSSFLIDAFVMSQKVDKRYIFCYMGGAGLYWLLSFVFKEKISELSKSSLNAENSLTAILLKGWDNIVCGNKYNFKKWENEMNTRLNNSRKSTVKYTSFSRVASCIITNIAIFPILGITSWLFMNGTKNPGEKAILLAILPRQIQTINYFDSLSYSLVQLAGIKNKVKLLSSSISEEFIQEWQEPQFTIFWNKLRFSDQKGADLQFLSPDSLLSAIDSMKHGRITIRGDNGAGKSVLMCKIKSHLSANNKGSIYYLPPTSQLVFDADTRELSTGQKRFKEMNEVLTNVRTNFMLLDEWDANLDQSNIQILSKKLDCLSKELCIIEARHREDEGKIQLEQKDGIPELVSFKKKSAVLNVGVESGDLESEPLIQSNHKPLKQIETTC